MAHVEEFRWVQRNYLMGSVDGAGKMLQSVASSPSPLRRSLERVEFVGLKYTYAPSVAHMSTYISTLEPNEFLYAFNL